MSNKKLAEFDCTIDNDNKVRRYTAPNRMRLSLAYGQLEKMPGNILSHIAERIYFLDLSHNSFKDLSFLTHFPKLQTLILDRNFKLVVHTLPAMKNLQILWLNNCNIINTVDWLHKLQAECPNLSHLSMMCNPVGKTILNGVTVAEEYEYRQQVIKLLPQLNHFDGVPITEEQRRSSSSQESLLSLIRLDDVFRLKLRIRKLSNRWHKRFKSMENVNNAILAFCVKKAASG